jgi:protoheme IX farnesyltransferase
VATGRISTGLASAFSIFLTMLGSLILFLLVGYNAALVGLISWILYSIIYTYLKRLTTLSTIIGAVPGALPPVIGYTAATGHPGVGGWLLFLIVFVWQFPHFLAIGWMHREDYKKAGIKTLSVTDPTGRQTSRQIVLYSLALLPVSLAPSLLGFAGFFYMIAALVISLLFIKTAWKCRPENLDAMSRPLFLKTLLYLPLLLGLLLLDHSLLTF